MTLLGYVDVFKSCVLNQLVTANNREFSVNYRIIVHVNSANSGLTMQKVYAFVCTTNYILQQALTSSKFAAHLIF